MMFLDCPASPDEDGGQHAQRPVSPRVQSAGMTCQPWVTGSAETTSADLQGDTMTTTRTAIGRVPGADRVMTPRRADARLAPGGPNGPRERDARPLARRRQARCPARWQLVLDLLDPALHRSPPPGRQHRARR